MNTLQTNNTNEIKTWFNDLVQGIRLDQLLLENDVIDEDKKKVYEGLIKQDFEPMLKEIRQTSSAFYIKKILSSYFKELASKQKKPNKFALELSDSKILIWAEIKNEDEEMEDILILSEAKINAEFSKYGFNISSTIVEENDGLEVPNHYHIIES